MKLRCVVACHDVDGPNLYYVKVECTQQQYAKKQHYEAAEGFISENYDVRGPFWVCDETDACGMELIQRHEWDWDETFVGEEHVV
jgi:hypothetical protein